MLHIIGTPIGNLQDITLRALDILKQCQYVLAEDTRVTKILFDKYTIDTPLRSYHAFSEQKQLQSIFDDLTQGIEVGLVSDAGMPGISDPGNLLIQKCRREGIPLTVYPGASAFLTALISTGLSEHPFQFRGFFSQKKQREEVALALYYRGITIYYEAPHRILDTLSLFPEDAQLFLVRELTKKFEELRQGSAWELSKYFQEHPPRGEFVLLVYGYKKITTEPSSLVKELMDTFSIDQKTALKVASELLGIPKRDVYKQCHDIPS